MDRTLGEFVTVLRKTGVEVSAAETIDAANTMELVGYADRETLKLSLGMVLAKTEGEQELFGDCFERFFAFHQFSAQDDDQEAGDEQDSDDPNAPARSDQAVAADGQAGGPGGGGMGQDGEGGTGGAALRDLLLDRDQAGLELSMAQAARAVGLNQIVLFTQRGMFTRRIVEEMGLDEFDAEISELRRQEDAAAEDAALLRRLEAARRFLFDEVRDFVEEKHATSNYNSTKQKTAEKSTCGPFNNIGPDADDAKGGIAQCSPVETRQLSLGRNPFCSRNDHRPYVNSTVSS